jgi:hypothetical protein
VRSAARRGAVLGAIVAIVVTGFLIGSIGLAAGQAAPLRATLRFTTPPPAGGFGAADPIPLTLTIQNISGVDVLTTEGFSTTEYWRRLYFVDPLGRLVINEAEAAIHRDSRVYQCLSRSQRLLAVGLPVVPAELLGRTFAREYEMGNARGFFDLTKPGRYRVNARVPLQTFVAGSADVIGDCDQFEGQIVVNVGATTGAQSFVVQSNTLEFEIVNTGTGAGVAVQPVDTTTGGTPVTVTFAGVTAGGATTLTTSASGSPPPAGFAVGNPATYYEIATSAQYAAPVTVCISYDPAAFGAMPARIFHLEDGDWEDVTVSVTPAPPVACGEVSSLSPFALFAGTGLAPVANAGPDRSAFPGQVVTLDGRASADPDTPTSGLTFRWTQIGGPVVSLSGADAAIATFVPGGSGTYSFQLEVSDDASVSRDTVTVVASYQFSGFQKPLCGAVAAGTPPTCGTIKAGGNISIKFRLLDAKGASVGVETARIRAARVDGSGEPVTEAVSFDPVSGQYQLDFKTKGLSAGLWQIDALLGDGTIRRSVRIELR